MNPYERRIIHSALQNDKYVTTHSEGEEPFRRVVVTPKRESNYSENRGYRGNRDNKYRNSGNREYKRENRDYKKDRNKENSDVKIPEGNQQA